MIHNNLIHCGGGEIAIIKIKDQCKIWTGGIILFNVYSHTRVEKNV